MLKNRKILITGVAGFIGYNLAKRLINNNYIIGIDNFEYAERKHCKDLIETIDFIEGDVSKKDTLEKLPKDIDYVFHFGSPSSIILFDKNPFHCYEETVLGTLNVFEFAKRSEVKKVIIPSSGSVYAGNPLPHSENIYPRPRNLYAAAKLACEAIAFSYKDFVESVCLRIFAGYGPFEERKGNFGSVIYLFINDILNNKEPIIFGDGNQSRDFIFIDDVIDAIIKAAEINYTGIINVGTGISTTFNEVVKIINEILGKNIKPKYIPKKRNYVEKLRADVTLMKRKLGINPTPLKVGIKKFIEHLTNGEL